MIQTTNYMLNLPNKGQPNWDTLVNDNFNTIDGQLKDKTNKIGDLTANGITEPSLAEAIKNNRSQLNEKAKQVDLNTLSLNVASKVDTAYLNAQLQNMNNIVQGFFSSVSNLTSAYPTGNTSNYVVIADNYIYRWNGTAWVSTGFVFSGGSIAIGSLGIEKFSFLPLAGVIGKNNFNKLTVTTGYYVDYNTGNLVVNASYSASDWIPVLPNTKYVKNSTKQFAFYDSSKNYISGLNTDTTFTTPSNCAYIRLSLLNTEKDILQLELGSISTTYESYRGMIDVNTIYDKSIEKAKLAFEIPSMVLGKNKFNKNTVTAGYYVDYTKGTLSVNASYSAGDFIPVQPNTQYSKNNTKQFAFYDINKTYISGLNTDTTFTTPANCYYVRLSLLNTEVDTLQLEQGGNSTQYEGYGYKISSDNLPVQGNNQNLLIINKSDSAINTLDKALALAKDSSSNPVTIVLPPGIYVGYYNLVGRYITLLGTDRENCIIKNYLNDYTKPPIDFAPNNSLINLTIIADDDGVTTPKTDDTSGVSAYAVHADIAGRYSATNPLYQGTAYIKNCKLISKHYQALGGGFTINQKLIVEGCEFIATNGISNAFRIHNYQPTGGSNCELIAKNCVFYSYGNVKPLKIQEVNHASGGGYDNVDTKVTFHNCIAYNDNGKNNCLEYTTPFDSTCVSGYIKRGISSFGNSILELNA